MIVALVAAALADPLALRAPGSDRAPDAAAWSVAASGGSLSAGAWLPASNLGFALEGDVAGGPVGTSVAYRTRLRTQTDFGVDLVGAAGLLVPLVDPGVVVALTPSATVGWRGRVGDATLGLVTPMAIRVAPDPAFSVPIRLEPWFGVHAGPVTVGAGAAAAFVVTPGTLWAVDLRWMVSVSART